MEIQKLQSSDFPYLLTEIDDPPKELFLRGQIPETEKYLAIVGSRSHSTYGKEVCKSLVAGLAGQSVTIVSGLALGIDTIAHRAALENNLPTLSVLGSGLNERYIYPSSNRRLAKDIINSGGGLLSEFEPDFQATKWSFPKRNRIMAGLSHATLLIEAEEKSGTLITARLATEYNREVLAVPGSIFSKTSIGTNRLITEGAKPILESKDILESLDLKATDKQAVEMTEAERQVFQLLDQPQTKDQIAKHLQKDIIQTSTLISLMEINGLVRENNGKIWKIQ